jgi:hypothetical protein
MKNKANKTGWYSSFSVVTIVLAAAIGLMSFCGASARADMQFQSRFFIVPAPTSPNYVKSMQNIMNYMDKGSLGFIDTDTTTNPAAWNSPSVLRGCQICFGPATFFMWDGTNAPTGNFASENGSWIAWAFTAQDTAPFQVNSGTFASLSTDHANSLSYGGNLATNTANNLPLTFGDTLRGQVWDGTNITADYHNGEPISNPVTRVIGIIRVGWLCQNMTDVASDMNYFKTVMEITNSFVVNFPNGGMTNSMSSIVYPDSPVVDLVNGTAGINIEGQRHMGLFYSLQRTFDLGNPVWKTVLTNGTEGLFVDSPVYSKAFYRAVESSTPVTPLLRAQTVPSIQTPHFVGANGPE